MWDTVNGCWQTMVEKDQEKISREGLIEKHKNNSVF